MGTILSSTRNYNRALAKQPRKSIGLSNIEVPNIQQEPLVGTLSIPYPVRISHSNDRIPDSFTEPSRSELEPPFKEPIQSSNLSPVIDNQIKQTQSIIQPPLYSSQPMYNQTMNNDAFVIRRSFVNLNKHQRLNNNQLAISPPTRSIVERNGKKFLSELKERMERRYVQVFDENRGYMRLFEVTDYIPTRTVRSVNNNSQFQSRNNPSRNFMSTGYPVNQRPSFRDTYNTRTKPSNLLDFQGLNNQGNINREFDLYHSGANLPFDNAPRIPPSRPQIPAQDLNNSSYYQPQRSESNAYNSSTGPSQNEYSSGSYQSQPQSFRPHSPTASDYSITASNTHSNSDNSDAESINRVLTPTHLRSDSYQDRTDISYGTLGGRNSEIEPDLFAKPVRTGDHMYTKRPGVNNYSELMTNNRGRGPTGISDYAPLPMAYNQSNQNYRDDSNAYNG